jgi:carboxypeptidase C (cathepsin A)
MRIRTSLPLAIAVFCLFSAALPNPARAADDAKPAGGDEKKTPAIPEAPKPAVTHHKLAIGGKTIAYTATAGTIDLKNADGDTIGRMFSVAYTLEAVTDPTTRPVTFCFNGGPGSSTLWLHMASFGPVRVETTDAGSTPPAPYSVVDNDDSLLDVSDLVFVDAIGTGFSRIVGKGEGKDFYGTDADIQAFGQFVERWLSANGRWNSPKFLLGESYGTTRAAGMLAYLQNRGTAFNGAVMVSSYFNAWHDFSGPAFALDLPYELYLPTVAATAWYHDKLDPKPAELAPFLDEVRAFALGDYAHALAMGSRLGAAERDAVLAKLHRYTSLSEEFLKNADLRVDPSRFEKELLRSERRTVGRLDARFLGIDHDAAGEYPETDAAEDAFGAAMATSVNAYLRGALGYSSDDLYKPTNYADVGKDWDDRHRIDGRRYPVPDVAEDLRQAMSANPHLQIFQANGYFDFACPFFETEYGVEHMGLDPALEKNIVWGYYPSGHMIYMHPPSRRQMKSDMAEFYRRATTR